MQAEAEKKDPSRFITRRGLGNAESYFLPALTFAHRALAAAEIFALAAALILRLLRGIVFPLPPAELVPPNSRCRSRCNVSILSLRFAARRSCFDVRSIIFA
jgi:hypothetical protein